MHGLRRLGLIAAALTFLTVVMGSVVCATDSSAACPNWPGCYVDGILPRAELNPLIEGFHRLVAILTTPLVLAVAIWATRARLLWWQRALPWVALVGCLLAGAFGMMIILFTLPLPLAIVDVGSSLVALAAMIVFVTTMDAPWAWTRAARLAAAALATLLALHLTALLAAGPGSYTRCLGWPAIGCVAADPSPAWAVIRWVLAAAVVVLLGLAYRASRDRGGLLVFGLLGAAVVLASVVLAVGVGGPWASLNSTLAVATWGAVSWWAARLGRR